MAIDEVTTAGAAARSVGAIPSSAADLAARIARLRAEITELVGLDPAVDGASGPALHAELRTAAGQLHAFAARILARVEADGRWSASGSRTFPDWVARRQLASTGSVRREVTLGRALDQSLPRTATALADGQVTLEHAEVLARVAATTPARLAALASDHPDRNEAALLESARRMPLDSYRREVDRWATQVDATAAEAEHEAACAKEYLTLSRRHDGVALQGFLTLENAEVLATALRSVAGVPSQGETRSREERQAAALVDVGRLILDGGLAGGGQQVRPHLLVHVPAETLHRVQGGRDVLGGRDGSDGHEGSHGSDGSDGPPYTGQPAGSPSRLDGLAPATLQDGSPIPPSTLARLICDGELSRIVFGADGAVLDVGRARRTYSGQQRLAVIARDRTCRYPGCGAPPTLGEVHHVTSWADGGPTSVANGVLLCWHHHAYVHRRGIRIARTGSGWDFRRGDGSVIDDGRSVTAGGAPPGARAPADSTVPHGARSSARAGGLAAPSTPSPAASPTSATSPTTTGDARGTRSPASAPPGGQAPAGPAPHSKADVVGPAPSTWGGPPRASGRQAPAPSADDGAARRRRPPDGVQDELALPA